MRVVAEAQLVLQVAQPGAVDVEHAIRPGLPIHGVAGMHVTRVHQHQRAGRDLLARLFIEVGAAALGDGADRKTLMGMLGVAQQTAIEGFARFHEGQRRVAPEAWGGGLLLSAHHASLA